MISYFNSEFNQPRAVDLELLELTSLLVRLVGIAQMLKFPSDQVIRWILKILHDLKYLIA